MEIKLPYKYILAFAVGVVVASAVVPASVRAAAGHRNLVAGLEGNARYTELVAEEVRLTRMSDSLSRETNVLRRRFRADTLDREALSAAILGMEEKSFEIRSLMAGIAGLINTMEQEWILRSLESSDTDKKSDVPERLCADLVYSSPFERELPPAQWTELKQAQDAEREVAQMVEQFLENNERMRSLEQEYRLADTQSESEEIKGRFDALARINTELEARTGAGWSAIFEDKTYAYSLFAEKSGLGDLSKFWASTLERMREVETEMDKVSVSNALVDYVIQKPALILYEKELAKVMGNVPALDSLTLAQGSVPGLDVLDRLSPVRLRERSFMVYDDVKMTSSPYNVRNPIPRVKIWSRGVMYRILTGVFDKPQQISVFKGVSPLGVLQGEDGKYRYYAGGFASEDEAAIAVEKMRKAGFKNPEIAVWMDGVYFPAPMEMSDVDSEGAVDVNGKSGIFFRIELSGITALSSQIEAIIRSIAGKTDIVRGSDGFVVGPIDNASVAKRLRLALEEGELSAKIVEIAE